MTNSASSNMKLVPWMHETQIITYVLVAGSLKEFIPGYKFFMKTQTTFQFLSTNHLSHLFQLYINCLFFCVFHRFNLHIFTWSTIDKCFLMYTPSAAFFFLFAAFFAHCYRSETGLFNMDITVIWYTKSMYCGFISDVLCQNWYFLYRFFL